MCIIGALGEVSKRFKCVSKLYIYIGTLSSCRFVYSMLSNDYAMKKVCVVVCVCHCQRSLVGLYFSF